MIERLFLLFLNFFSIQFTFSLSWYFLYSQGMAPEMRSWLHISAPFDPVCPTLLAQSRALIDLIIQELEVKNWKSSWRGKSAELQNNRLV